MEQGKIDMPRFLMIILVYTVLSMLGIFAGVEMILCPVFAVPFALYYAKYRPPFVMQLMVHLIMLVLNYTVSEQGIIGIAGYTAGVIIPMYVIVYFYDQQLTLPHFIMYTGMSLLIMAFGFWMLLKRTGIDLELMYIHMIDNMKTIVRESIDQVMLIEKQNGSAVAYTNEFQEKLKYMLISLEKMKSVFGYAVTTIELSLSALTVIIFNGVLRIRQKDLPAIRQLLEFRLSKAAIFIYIASITFMSLAGTRENSAVTAGMNIVNVFMWLFTIAGSLGVIGLIKKSSAGRPLKVLGYIGVAFSFGMFPYILMIFGCLDTFFNYRKVEIVV